MTTLKRFAGMLFVVTTTLGLSVTSAKANYWNVFNDEQTSNIASFVTYDSLLDMLNDENRTGSFAADGFLDGSFGANIVGSGSDGVTYWNIFNAEETSNIAIFVTYDSLLDMLNDENRTGSFPADGFLDGSFGANIVGSGSDGTTYWNLFNAETTANIASFITYDSLLDMLNDENRTGSFAADGFLDGSFGANIVGSGSDGTTYWNLFNAETTSNIASFITYDSLLDMLNDENRTGAFAADGFLDGSFGANIVGTGALVSVPNIIPEPGTLPIFVVCLTGLAIAAWRRKPH